MTETAETPAPDHVVDAIFMELKGDCYTEIDSYPVEWKELKDFKAVRE